MSFKQKAEPKPRDKESMNFVYVVDTSGSMRGNNFAALSSFLKEAYQRALKTATLDSRVVVIAFDNKSVVKVDKRLSEINPENDFSGENLMRDMGGLTKPETALPILDKLELDQRKTVVMLPTDGGFNGISHTNHHSLYSASVPNSNPLEKEGYRRVPGNEGVVLAAIKDRLAGHSKTAYVGLGKDYSPINALYCDYRAEHKSDPASLTATESQRVMAELAKGLEEPDATQVKLRVARGGHVILSEGAACRPGSFAALARKDKELGVAYASHSQHTNYVFPSRTARVSARVSASSEGISESELTQTTQYAEGAYNYFRGFNVTPTQVSTQHTSAAGADATRAQHVLNMQRSAEKLTLGRGYGGVRPTDAPPPPSGGRSAHTHKFERGR